MEDTLRNKTLYKILLILLKYIPIIIGIPLTDKCLVFNTQDIQIFKDTLLNKK